MTSKKKAKSPPPLAPLAAPQLTEEDKASNASLLAQLEKLNAATASQMEASKEQQAREDSASASLVEMLQQQLTDARSTNEANTRMSSAAAKKVAEQEDLMRRQAEASQAKTQDAKGRTSALTGAMLRRTYSATRKRTI